MIQILKKVWHYITSRKFAIYLLIIISSALIVGSFLPKIDFIPARELEQLKKSEPYYFLLASLLSPSRIVRSYPFFIVWILLLNSTVVCTYRRVKGRFKLRKFGKKFSIANLSNEKQVLRVAASKEGISSFVKTVLRGWQLCESKDGIAIKAEKGGIGFWGSILFHVGLIALFIGAGITGLTRYDASFLITENQSVFLPDLIVPMSEQRPVINLNSEAVNAIISLKNIKAKYGRFEQLTDIYADFSIAGLDNSFVKDVVKVNKPLYFKNLKIVIEKYGIAPNFQIKNKQNKIVDEFVINLGDWLPENWTEKGTFDSFEIPDSNLIAKVLFVPNYKKIKGKVVSQGKLIKTPAFVIKFLDKKTLKEVSESIIQKNQGAKFGDKQLVFKDLNYWGFFRLSKDGGAPIIIFSLLLGIFGLAIRFIYHDKTIWVYFEESELSTNVKIVGKSKYFPALFKDEINKISDKIKNEFKIKSD